MLPVEASRGGLMTWVTNTVAQILAHSILLNQFSILHASLFPDYEIEVREVCGAFFPFTASLVPVT